MSENLDNIKALISKTVEQGTSAVVLNPPLALDKVRAIQNRISIVLPEEYVDFITQVGDGGILPPYSPDCKKLIGIAEYEALGYSLQNISKPFTLEKSWMPDWGDTVSNDNDRLGEAEREHLVSQQWKMIRENGHIVLMDDSTDNNIQWILIVNGPCRGEVWQVSEYGAFRLSKCGFLKWLKLYLEGSLDNFMLYNKSHEYPSSKDYIEHCKTVLLKHKIVMNPPATIEQIKEFEQMHNVTLPKEFIEFLTNIGDGSKKSPWYVKKIRALSDFQCLRGLDKPFLIQTEEDYKQMFNQIFGRSNVLWDQLPITNLDRQPKECWLLPRFQTLQGCIPLLDRGNPSSKNDYVKQYILILNGVYQGQVWGVDNWGLYPTDKVLLDGSFPINAITCVEARIIGII